MSANLQTVSRVIPIRPQVVGGMFDAPKFPGCTFTPTGLIIKPGMKVEQWIELGFFLRGLKDGLALWVGDWICYGQKAIRGHKYDQALALTGYTEGTLKNNVYVAKRVPPDLRPEKSPRGDFLKFNHYKKVAPLKTRQAIRKWLGLAVKGDGSKPWSAARLGREIEKASAPPPPIGLSAEMKKLHEQAVKEDIEVTIAAIRARNETPVDPILSTLNNWLIKKLEWQRDRTIQIDCEVIAQAVEELLGTRRQVEDWLSDRGYVMKGDELTARLELMIEKQEIMTEHQSRLSVSSGTTVLNYVPFDQVAFNRRQKREAAHRDEGHNET